MIRKHDTDWTAMAIRLQRDASVPPRVLSYDRVSGVVQTKGRGLGRQKDAAEKWCKDRNLTLDTSLSLSDPGRSASKGHHIAKDAALGRLLAMVDRGQIEPGTILLVEAIDRLSRLSLMTGLQEVIFALIQGGLRIITLEDGAEYSLESIENDWSKVLTLVVRVQAAYEYTKRLKDRITDSWDDTRKRLENGEVVRPNAFRPSWCDYVNGRFVLNDKAEIVRLVFESLRTRGVYATASYLNEKGIPTLTGKRWTPGTVSALAVKTDSVFGTLVHNSDRRGSRYRSERDLRGLTQQVYENFFPVCVPKDEVMSVRALMSARNHGKSFSGPNGSMRWFGKGFTYCSCGSRMTTHVTTNRWGKTYRTIRCTSSMQKLSDCKASAYHIRPLMAHILTRLKPEYIRQIVGGDDRNKDSRLAATKELADAQEALTIAHQKAKNSSAALEKAILEGWELGDFQRVLQTSREWVKQCEKRVDSARVCVDAFSKAGNYTELEEPVKELLIAVHEDNETNEQRKALNVIMHQLRFTIIASADGKQIGIGVGDGPIHYEPFDAEMALESLANGYLDVRYHLTASGFSASVA